MKHHTINKMARRNISVILTLTVAIGIMIILLAPSKPRFTVGEIPGINAADFAVDSTFRDNRQMGLISLDKFIGLAEELGSSIFNKDSNIMYNKDSIKITLSNTTKNDYFFGDFTNVGQLDYISKQYKDFPIRIINNGTGFYSEVTEINNHKYIKIPYLVLTSLAKYVYGESSTAKANISPETELPTITPKNKDLLFNKKMDNKKIQTEGVVFRNFSGIQAEMNKKKTSDQVEQLKYVWEYVNEHWLYINDPNTDDGSDTWRSATETVTNYYSNGHMYTGDCDDYAILMASFARQCGLESHLVCALKGDKGHMYAEFQKKGEGIIWHNLDWGMEFDSNERYGKVEKILNDL